METVTSEKRESRKRSRCSAADSHILRSSSASEDAQRSGLVALWEAGELCDVTIVCEGKECLAHKAVLAAGSAYLR
eukprot:CAMPEP_0119376850 /NCGR_PEP_ID=MMETSP1334-20130426/41694_1 /TAXON_ID=127549 /ORGANISM="Calcidiscus leptoporus, Strain RCC1130" /LENGTH=75 /DNA_ID=CAMNT_0007395549 /DNA_START=53 /DNA_END=277 /DNA_ORIENTATION=-